MFRVKRVQLAFTEYVQAIIGASLSEPHTSESNDRTFIYYILGECSALWGEPEQVAGALVFHRKYLGNRLRQQMCVMLVFVEECS